MYATVYIGVHIEILVAHGIENAKRFLRSGGIVEVYKRVSVHFT